GTYWVDVNLNGCSKRDSIKIYTKVGPIVNLGNDTTLCEKDTLRLDVSTPGATYLWQNNTALASYTISQSGTYRLEVTTQNNVCTTRDTIIVSYISQPKIDLGSDTSLCEKDTLKLDATIAGATYSWQNNSKSPFLDVSKSGTYWVDVDLN